MGDHCGGLAPRDPTASGYASRGRAYVKVTLLGNDPLLLYALRALGFEHLTPMDPHTALPSPQAEFFPTRSENTSVRECGMVIRDDSAVF